MRGESPYKTKGLRIRFFLRIRNLFLSEAAVEFYPYNTDGKFENVAILLDDITGMKSKGNRLIINTSNREYSFTVYNAKLWEEMIKKEL